MICLVAPSDKVSLLTEIQKQTAYEIIDNIHDIEKLVFPLKNAYHYTQIIIDISIIENNQNDILKALYQLKTMNSAKLIIIAQGKCIGDIFLSQLVNLGMYNFIVSYVPDIAQREMSECIKGRTLEDVEQYLIKSEEKKKSFFNFKFGKKVEPIIIQIVGLCHRIGTTTQAMRITKSLISSGYKACYVECNASCHLSLIKNVFSDARALDETTTVYCDIPLCSEVNDNILKSYEYIVCDYGCYFDLTHKLSNSYPTVVVAGSTAWEIFKLPELIQNLNSFNDVKYIFSFTGKKEEEDILDFMQENWTKTFFAEYTPDMFSELSESQKQMYDKLISIKKQ